MRASDIRCRAREALRGNWFIAVIAGIVAGIFGASGGSSVSFNYDFSESDVEALDPAIVQQAEQMLKLLLPFLIGAAIFALVYSIVIIIIGSVVSVGYSQFNLDLVDGATPRLGTLFSRFNQMKSAICASLLIFLYVFIGIIFFFIPGIIISYQYSMTFNVLAENPTLTARQAMRRSKEIMRGNKWRYFCLNVSFIGWELLCIVTLGVASLWVIPYKRAAYAVFYREIGAEVSYISW